MINIKELTQKDIGRFVEYKTSYGKIETGRIKSWNEYGIFVVYHCNDSWDEYENYTGACTDSRDLTFKETI